MSMKFKTLLVTVGILAGLSTDGAWGAEALQNYEKHCMKCHGKDGKGATKMGRQSGAKDYSDPKVQAEMKDEEAFNRIRVGMKEGGKEKMKPYADVLSDDEIRALVTYMRTFKK
jgi:mono/diheme cytochrome c family protein